MIEAPDPWPGNPPFPGRESQNENVDEFRGFDRLVDAGSKTAFMPAIDIAIQPPLPHALPLLRAAFLSGCLLSSSGASAQIARVEEPGPIRGPEISRPALPGPRVFEARPGPWGRLRCSYVYLEAPAQLLENFPLPSLSPRWTFPAAMAEALPKFLADTGLPQALTDFLLADGNAVRESGWIHLIPPPAELEEIAPETRAVIYAELSKYPENEYHANPVLITTSTVDEWYTGSALRPELIARIKKLSYRRGHTIAFSDIPLLLNFAESDSEARSIFKAATRTRTIMVRLILDETANARSIVDYWTLGIGLRRKDIEPLIHSIMETNGAEDLGISHLLPPLARKLLYTYPGPELAKHGIMPDCHWTSLNFFHYEPHEYLLDARLATSKVLEQFLPVEEPYRYGDILFFLDKTTEDAFHSCIYLADDLVYTKNGRNILAPWVIMRMEDLDKIYLYQGNGSIQGYRRKDAAD